LSADAILIDTSVWIEFFRRRSDEVSTLISDLIAQDRARICGLIVAELIQGAKSAKEVEALAQVGRTLKHLPEPPALWEKAGRLANNLRRQGRTIHIVDCYLAALAHENKCPILTLDSHFKTIATMVPISLAQVEPEEQL
jgi:tRNA(fMet)-specific endonuclease VapC